MAATPGIVVCYNIGLIFKRIINCVRLHFTNGFTNIVLKNVNCLCLVAVTVIFDGTPQIGVQRCQIVTDAELIRRSSKTGRKTSSVASAVEAKCCQYPSFQFLWIKIRSIWIDNVTATSCLFWKKIPNYVSGPKSTLNSVSLRYIGFSMYACPKCNNFCEADGASPFTKSERNLRPQKCHIHLEKGCLYIEDFIQAFYESKIFRRSSIYRRPKKGHLFIKLPFYI